MSYLRELETNHHPKIRDLIHMWNADADRDEKIEIGDVLELVASETGNADMLKIYYDPTGVVKDAGGIPEYVSSHTASDSMKLNTDGSNAASLVTFNNKLEIKGSESGTVANTFNFNQGFIVGHGSVVGNYATALGLKLRATGVFSHAEGCESVASGPYSHAEGYQTSASNEYTHTEGGNTTASGKKAHAEGGGTKALGENSHAEGESARASEKNSHAEGYGTTAGANASHAEGTETVTEGNSSHAEGCATTAKGLYSHAEGGGDDGYGTFAEGQSSHAEGSGTTAKELATHAEGRLTLAEGQHSHVEGQSTLTTSTATNSHAEGYGTTAGANASHAEGVGTCAGYTAQHVGGKYNSNKQNTLFEIGNGTSTIRSNAFEVYSDGNLSTNNGTTKVKLENLALKSQIPSVSNGNPTLSWGSTSTIGTVGGTALTVKMPSNNAEDTKVAQTADDSTNSNFEVLFSGTADNGSRAEGARKSTRLRFNPNKGSMMEGSGTSATGSFSHAEGNTTKSTGSYAHSEGSQTTAEGGSSHSEGVSTYAPGASAHAEGGYTTASGNYSSSSGYHTKASKDYQSVVGKYNQNKDTTLFEVGNGSDDTHTSNAFEVYSDGTLSTDGGITKLGIGTIYEEVLQANTQSVEFQVTIGENSFVDVYTNKPQLSYSEMSYSSGKLTIKYEEAQTTDTRVRILVR